MKCTLLLCLLLAGCGEHTPLPDHSIGIYDGGFVVCARVYTVEIEGHRFAVVKETNGNGVGICEVTDASLVKTNADNQWAEMPWSGPYAWVSNGVFYKIDRVFTTNAYKPL